jgi:crotonobetainyl-CoA:carnitine CoA-transferase CaiB-like acyl-CoA transferase
MDEPPLAGIKVVEMTAVYSGPYAGLILAELGADVVKVEGPGHPDMTRRSSPTTDPDGVSAVFYSLNRGKRFVGVDATTSEGQAVLHRLIAEADVFLHNVRPSKLNSLGVDYPTLAAVNERLIYAAISGYGSEGADAELPVYDFVVQAQVGMVDYQRDLETGTPALISQFLVDKSSANAVVQAILAALFVRTKTGRGQRVEVPMVRVGMHFSWPDAMGNYLAEVESSWPSMLPHTTLLPAKAFHILTTSDGGEIACGPGTPPFDGFAIALGRPEWVVDDRFADLKQRRLHYLELVAEIRAAALQQTTDELMANFAANDVAAGVVRKRDTLHDDPLVKRLGLMHEQTAPYVGRVRQPHPMWTFSDNATKTTTQVGRVGDDTVAVLTELGMSDADVAQLRRAHVVS